MKYNSKFGIGYGVCKTIEWYLLPSVVLLFDKRWGEEFGITFWFLKFGFHVYVFDKKRRDEFLSEIGR